MLAMRSAMINGYLVCDEPRGMACWLVLSGPFGYSNWTGKISDATPMPYSTAHAWAAAVGTVVNGELRARVVPTSRAPQVVKAIIKQADDAADRMLSMVDLCWDGDGS
jgi:hypothetical protein